jgi:hypothetical protein
MTPPCERCEKMIVRDKGGVGVSLALALTLGP